MEVTPQIFTALIEKVIGELKDEYKTLGSLSRIMEQIQTLPTDEQIKHSGKIVKIKGIIKGYNIHDDRALSVRQYNTLQKVLEEVLYGPKKLSKSTRWPYSTSYTNYNINPMPIYNQVVTVIKFDLDDIICGIVFNLIADLNQGSMGSTLTLVIMDYFEVIESVLADDPIKYKDITSEIKTCFEKHGWKCKSDKTAGGFQTAPNPTALATDLNAIINRYF